MTMTTPAALDLDQPIPYTLTDRHALTEAQRQAGAVDPYADLDLAALRAATKDALSDLVRLSETASWGDIDDVEVDHASAVFCELQDAYHRALIASTKGAGDR
jgi:hypothetical protein